MEVTRSNFKESLDKVLQDIEDCDFISCDGEFTGISNESFKAMPFDTVSERYEKLRQGNMNYLMCQVGLCMFIRNEDGGYTVKPYNFYVMPRPFFNKSPEFVCQASCIQFLATHGFDFNKVFLDGISYLRPADESKIKDKLTEKQEEKLSTPKSTPTLSLKAEDKQFIETLIESVEKYIADENNTEPLNLEPCSPWRRKLTYQHLESKYPDNLHLQAAGEGKVRYIVVTKVNAKEKQAKEKAVFNDKLQELEAAVGFSHVIKAVSHSQKLVVGHNMLLDVMYVISQFMAELPETYEEFKAMTTELFPKLLDTKVMSSTYLFKEDIPFNALDEMVKCLESSLYKQVAIDIPEDFPSYHKPNKDTQFHNAAYDAFMTGKCFLIMAEHVGQKAEPPVLNLASNCRLLTPFINKLFINRLQDIPYMNLGGPEVVPDRDHVYYITFPKTWTRNDINQVFFPSLIYVAWIDDVSAMITLQQRSENAQVRKLLKSQSHSCVVMSYEEWHRALLSSSAKTSPSESSQTKPSADSLLTSKSRRGEKRKNKANDDITPIKQPKPELDKTEEPSTPVVGVDITKTRSRTDKLFEESGW